MSTAAATAFPKAHLIPTSGTYPHGFVAGAVASGIKKKPGVLDMTMVRSELPCTAAGVFTKNVFAAAPVQVDRDILTSRSGQGLTSVLVNAGCANACTGDQGLDDAWSTSRYIDSQLGVQPHAASGKPSSLVMSTGVIGQPLKMDKIRQGVDELTKTGTLTANHAGWSKASQGIMTTDTFPKLRSREFTSRSFGQKYRIAGWCKGAGMIHPNMATMLAAVFTDADVSAECLDKALRHAADRSFNAVSVDGDTSTNDSYVILANGASGVKVGGLGSDEFQEFTDNLTEFSADLAKLIVRDGEGATKFIEIIVENGRSFDDAKQIASTIATSPLVKTAIYGKDANWGRIVCAVGYSGIEVDPGKVNLRIESGDGKKQLHLFKNGAPFDVDEAKAAEILNEEDIVLRVDLGMGKETATMYTCDMTHEYISINADYRS
ncbi:hypothetical protein HK101_001081 [Irineochytrium annulatum]|nr:hypothetical protein HK101_001081 [Irineochytrium annulatum]